MNDIMIYLSLKECEELKQVGKKSLSAPILELTRILEWNAPLWEAEVGFETFCKVYSDVLTYADQKLAQRFYQLGHIQEEDFETAYHSMITKSRGPIN